MNNTIIASFLGVLALVGVNRPVAIAPEPEAKPNVVINQTVEQDRVDKWLDLLALCESGGVSDIKVLDTNYEYSYGLLQFQEKTFITQTKKYGLLPEAEEKEIMNWIFDPVYQKKLAKLMVEDSRYEGWTHWTNCANIIGWAGLSRGQ